MLQTATADQTLHFAGYDWTARATGALASPGPSRFSDENAWVDDQGRLHLRVAFQDGAWQSAEVISQRPFGYGRYVFYTVGNLDRLDKNVVLGLFTYDEDNPPHHSEIDIEFARWGTTSNSNGQFGVQPANVPDHSRAFETQLTGDYSSQIFEWLPTGVRFASLHGHYDDAPSKANVIELWKYQGRAAPQPGNARLRMNLWMYQGKPPSDGSPSEIIIAGFQHTPYCGDSAYDSSHDLLNVPCARVDGQLRYDVNLRGPFHIIDFRLR